MLLILVPKLLFEYHDRVDMAKGLVWGGDEPASLVTQAIRCPGIWSAVSATMRSVIGPFFSFTDGGFSYSWCQICLIHV